MILMILWTIGTAVTADPRNHRPAGLIPHWCEPVDSAGPLFKGERATGASPADTAGATGGQEGGQAVAGAVLTPQGGDPDHPGVQSLSGALRGPK